MEELNVRYGLEGEALIFCQQNDLHDLAAIVGHYTTTQTFFDLPGCTDVIADRLDALLTLVNFEGSRPISDEGGHSVVGNDTSEVKANSMTLEELQKVIPMSVRAINVCRISDLTTTARIREHYTVHGTFRNIRNCGAKTDLELLRLLHDPRFPQPSEGEVEVHSNWGTLEQAIIAGLECMSKPAREILRDRVGGLAASDVLLFMATSHGEWEKMPGVDSQIKLEWQELWDQVGSLSRSFHSAGDHIAVRSWLKRNGLDPSLGAFLLSPSGDLTMLCFLEHHIPACIGPTYPIICQPHLTMVDGVPSNAELAERVGLSRERVRQLLDRMWVCLPRYLAPMKDLPGLSGIYPQLVTNDPWKVIDLEDAACLNKKESTSWNLKFYGFLAGALNEGFELLPWMKDGKNRRKCAELEQSFVLVIRHELAKSAQELLDRLHAMNEKPRKKEARTDLGDLMAGLPSSQWEALSSLLQRVVPLILPEAKITGSVIRLPPNKRKNQVDLLGEVLEHLNRPSHVTEIRDAWLRLFPDRPVTLEGIRSLAVGNREKFFSIGRRSTYGLREWEASRPTVKGGTIRDLVEEQLANADHPLHVTELLAEVLKYRPRTTIGSLRQNLKFEASGRFRFFPNGYVGLGNRKFSRPIKLRKVVSGSLMRASVLKQFIGKNIPELCKQLQERSGATNREVQRVVKGAVREGRIQTNDLGSITSVSDKSGVLWGAQELPFQW